MSLDERKLREKLDLILDFMVENKLISKEAGEKMKNDNDGFLSKMVEDLSNSGMEDKDIRDEHFQKKLIGTLVSHSLGMNEAVKLGMDTLTNALTLKNGDNAVPLEETLGNPQATKTLDKLQAQHILVSSKLNTDGLRNNALAPTATPDFNALAKQQMTPLKMTMEKKLGNDENSKKEFEKLSKEMEKQLADTLRNAYAGDDPRITGEIQGPILGPILSVMVDWIEPVADPTSVAARVQEATENLPGNDHLGIKDKDKKANAGFVDEILSPVVDSLNATLSRPKLEHQ